MVPFVVSRLLSDTLLIVMAGIRGAHSPLWGFHRWDGRWYQVIALHGYLSPLHALHHQTPWPFFPLFPLVLHTGAVTGLSVLTVGVVVDHAAFFVALVAIRRLALRHTNARAADLAVWITALGPLAFVFSMLYPSAVFLAASAWAFVFVDERRDLAAGVLAAVAALSRPNGVVVVAALVVAVGFVAPRVWRVVLPAAGALGMWVLYNGLRGGDPLRFLDAKAAWHEVDVVNFVNHPTLSPAVHLALAGCALAAVLAMRRRLPASWTWLSVGYLVPSLALGVVGLARYATDLFPTYVASGALLERHTALVRTVLPALVVLQVACAAYFVAGHSVI